MFKKSLWGKRVRAQSEGPEKVRKRAEVALRESKKSRVFDQTFQFIGLMTPDGILVEANHAALAFAGIKESEAVGKLFWETPWWTHSLEMQDKLRAAAKTASEGQFVRFEATHRATDGSLHYIDFSLTPVKDKKGNVTFLVPEGRNITERKQAETEKVQKLLNGTINAIGKLCETRDPYTAGHESRVAALATTIARKMCLSEDRVEGSASPAFSMTWAK